MSGIPDSVHLAAWPTADESLIDAALDEAMEVTRQLVELGRSARAEASLKVRQPLARALIPAAVLSQLGPELVGEIQAELNVRQVDSFDSAAALVDYSVKANFRALGKRFGKQTADVAAAIAAADPVWVADRLRDAGELTLDWGGGTTIAADDVIVTERPRAGWSVVGDQGLTIGLDLTLTPDLVAAGQVRQFVRDVQELRKASGLDVSDRIRLYWAGTGEAAEAIEAAADDIAAEVLAVDVSRPDDGGQGWAADDELGVVYQVVPVVPTGSIA